VPSRLRQLGQRLVEHLLRLVPTRILRIDNLVHAARLARDHEVEPGWSTLGTLPNRIE
jgi:hypothetical protein